MKTTKTTNPKTATLTNVEHNHLKRCMECGLLDVEDGQLIITPAGMDAIHSSAR